MFGIKTETSPFADALKKAQDAADKVGTQAPPKPRHNSMTITRLPEGGFVVSTAASQLFGPSNLYASDDVFEALDFIADNIAPDADPLVNVEVTGQVTDPAWQPFFSFDLSNLGGFGASTPAALDPLQTAECDCEYHQELRRASRRSSQSFARN